jgi:hypothetical protein
VPATKAAVLDAYLSDGVVASQICAEARIDARGEAQ